MMKKAGYYIFFALNYVVTLLPLRVLYLFSDLTHPLMYHIFRYRRRVVEKNLENAFPEKSTRELRKIGRAFYRHLCDLFVETLKTTHMSHREIKRRFDAGALSAYDHYFTEGRDIVTLSSHYNNWEWFSALQMATPYKVITIYKPLKNKYFDRFLLNLRTRYGVSVTPMHRILRELVTCRRDNVRTMSGFIADQTPPPDENAFWTLFLNQETGFYRGAEKVAVKYGMPVVFINIDKVKRGYYKLDFKVITEHPSDETPDYITSRYAQMLEEVIRAKPEYWLWSHRRWKYKKPVKND
ncbi:MAG: lysophospholipid acyltransferase family protein [Bacteroidales bacterium]